MVGKPPWKTALGKASWFAMVKFAKLRRNKKGLDAMDKLNPLLSVAFIQAYREGWEDGNKSKRLLRRDEGSRT